MSPTSLMELQNLCRLLKMSNNSLKDPKSKEIEVWITKLHQVKLKLRKETIGFSSYLWSSFGLVVIVTWFAICDMLNCFGSVMWFVFFEDKLILILRLEVFGSFSIVLTFDLNSPDIGHSKYLLFDLFLLVRQTLCHCH